jgi:hypothetical protein
VLRRILPTSHLGGIILDPMLAILAPTINRTRAVAALPMVIGGSGSGFQLKNMSCAGSKPYLCYKFRHRLDQLGGAAIYLCYVVAS